MESDFGDGEPTKRVELDAPVGPVFDTQHRPAVARVMQGLDVRRILNR